MVATGTQAPPSMAIAMPPLLPTAFSWFIVRVIAVTRMPKALSASASTADSTPRASHEPFTRRPNSGPPSRNSTESWTNVTPTVGSTLPTMMSTELAGVARSRSQVPQPWSRKKLNPAYPTPNAAKPTAIAGTANSDPFAPAKPSSRRASANSCFISATITSGMAITKITVDGSVHITRSSCRRMARLLRGDTFPALLRFLLRAFTVGLVVPATGERQVDRLEARPDDLDRGEQAGRHLRDHLDQCGGRVGRGDPHPLPVDRRAVDGDAGHVAVEDQLEHGLGVCRDQLLDAAARDHRAVVEEGRVGAHRLHLGQVVRRVQDCRPVRGQLLDQFQDVAAGLHVGDGGG